MGLNNFSNCVFLLESAMIILYGTCTRFIGFYSSGFNPNTNLDNMELFSNFDAIEILGLFVLIGFAYLYVTALRYAWTSISHTLLIISTVLLLSPLWAGFWANCNSTRVNGGSGWQPIPLSISTFAEALYTAVTVMIAFGAVAGRASALQQLAIAFFGVMVVTANVEIMYDIRVVDVGGSMHVHTFGAAYGLMIALMLGSKATRDVSISQPRARATGAFGLIGTLVLFFGYPTFNSAELAANEMFNQAYNNPGFNADFLSGLTIRAYLNTLTGICASVMAAFFASKLFSSDGKFSFDHIQAATISGGAAIAALGPFMDNPYGTMTTAGIVAVLATGLMNLKIVKDRDALGVIALHLLPGMIGCIASGIAAARIITSGYVTFDATNDAMLIFNDRGILVQGGYQIAFGAISLGFGLIAGIVVGGILNLPIFDHKAERMGDDSEEWSLTEDVAPVVASKTVEPAATSSEPVPA